MIDPISGTLSTLALAVSATTAWLTLLRRGTVRMTHPSVIFFGPDENGAPKVYLRTLLFGTSKRGRIIESMYVRLSRNETRQNFNIWVYGDGKLVRGSGLFVGENGLSAAHHFLVPRNGATFKFVEGAYQVEVYAKLLGGKSPKLLLTQSMDVSKASADALTNPLAGLYFDWEPETGRYVPHIDIRHHEALIKSVVANNQLMPTGHEGESR